MYNGENSNTLERNLLIGALMLTTVTAMIAGLQAKSPVIHAESKIPPGLIDNAAVIDSTEDDDSSETDDPITWSILNNELMTEFDKSTAISLEKARQDDVIAYDEPVNTIETDNDDYADADIEIETVDYDYYVEDDTYLNSYGYDPSDCLDPIMGVYYGPSGKETYYNLPMDLCVSYMRDLGYDAYNYPYWVRDDGCKMLGDYIMIAANLDIRPKGTILQTSMGPGIVSDTCYAFTGDQLYQIDIATTW